MWDFVIKRSDGTAVLLHPRRKEKYVDTFDAAGPPEQVQPPPTGYGKSKGRGANSWYTNEQPQRKLMFDTQKGQHLPPSKKRH